MAQQKWNLKNVFSVNLMQDSVGKILCQKSVKGGMIASVPLLIFGGCILFYSKHLQNVFFRVILETNIPLAQAINSQSNTTISTDRRKMPDYIIVILHLMVHRSTFLCEPENKKLLGKLAPELTAQFQWTDVKTVISITLPSKLKLCVIDLVL